MLRMFSAGALRNNVRNAALYIQIAVLAVAGIAPLIHVSSASAEQLSSRSVTIGTSKPGATTTYDFKFSWASSLAPRGIILQFCDTPLGTCVLPGAASSTGYSSSTSNVMDVATSGAYVNQSGLPGGPMNTAVTSTTGSCNSVGSASSTMLCFTGAAGAASNASGATYSISGIKNPQLPDSPAQTNKTVFVRISMYSDTSFTTKILDGTVATSINQQLTVNGRVQEKLNFCVAAIKDSGATDDAELPTNVTACATPGGTYEYGSVVDLGVIDSSAIAKSPVANNPPSSLGNNHYAIAMLNTNAANGSAITYFAEPDTTGTNQTRAFRVPGATCSSSATTLTDQCFQSASRNAGGTSMTAGTELFGMNIPCIMNGDGGTLPAGYAPTTANLVADDPYDGAAPTSTLIDCEKSEAAAEKYGWNDTSTAAPIAESSVSGSKVVDNEIVKLNFAATAGATTPTGAYTVSSTYIATPTY